MVNTKKIKAIVLSSMLACMQLSLAPDEAQVLGEEKVKTDGNMSLYVTGAFYGMALSSIVPNPIAVAATLIGGSLILKMHDKNKKVIETDLEKAQREIKNLEIKTKAMNKLIEHYKTFKETLLVLKEEEGNEIKREEYIVISPREG